MPQQLLRRCRALVLCCQANDRQHTRSPSGETPCSLQDQINTRLVGKAYKPPVREDRGIHQSRRGLCERVGKLSVR